MTDFEIGVVTGLVVGAPVGAMLFSLIVEAIYQSAIRKMQDELAHLRDALMWAREDAGVCMACGEDTHAVRLGCRQCMNPFCSSKNDVFRLEK